MAKHTEGAVHLTSLSLDLMQFNENIQQIQNSTAEVADVAVQNLSKIKEALNVPTEQMRLSVDTTQLAQNVNKVQSSIEGLGNTYQIVSKEIQGGQLFSSKSFDDLVEALHLTGNEASVAHEKLSTLLASLDEYDKVSISASGGKLLQAVINTTDDAGAKIQKVIDLTKKLDDKFLEGSITISDNAEKRNAAIERQNKAIERQNEAIKKANNALADSLNRVISQYEKLAKEINKSDLSDIIKADFIQNITSAENGIKGLQAEIRGMNQLASKSDLSPRFEQFSKTLENISDDYKQAKQNQKDFLLDADKQIGKISNQFEKLSANIEKSDLSNLVKEELLNRIKEAQTNMQGLANEVAEVSSIAKKGDYDKEFAQVSVQLKNITTDFEQAKRSQKEFLDGKKRVEDLSQDYAQLQNRLAGLIYSMTTAKIDTPEMGESISKAKSLAVEMSNVAESVRNSDTVTESAQSTFNNFVETVSRLELGLKNAKTENAEYKNSLKPIQQTVQDAIASLKTLEKTAVFKTSKDQVAALRAKYEEFLNTLKNSNISVENAKEILAKLGVEFDTLNKKVTTGSGVLENWVNKITESAKWQIANRAINLLQQSFGQLTTTIIDTEDAIIELRRVLNDKSLVSSEMTQTLYDIAYEFGQTFENVQEVAVKFAQTGKTWEETVAATRATMLGLNTAELEVSTATEGLIAVMAQFNVEADDLEKVIDKINITADNFPVTSEKIVAALQRAGGTANAFGLSLEETIGVITALSKATGRAGEAIGTAMNSLITFSMKDSALDKFSEFLGQDVSSFGVLELWQALAEEIKNGNKSLATMMSTSEEFNSLMDEELATSIGLTEEFTKAQEEANKMTAEGKNIYSTVGTYRQNYFIALLNNIATATEAIKGMSGAVGYSMQENEVAMESFSKKWNQLIVSAKELAIQFGEAGFLDLMKGAVEASSAVLQLTKSIGGLRTALIALTTLLIMVKKEKFEKTFSGITTSIGSVGNAISIYRAYMATGATATQAMAAAVGSLKLTLGGLVGIVGIAVTAISAIVGAVQQHNEEADRARQEAIAAGAEAVEASKNLSAAYREYSKARSAGTADEQIAASEKMIQQLGYEITDVEILKNRYGDLQTAIETLMDAEYNRNKEAAKGAYEAKASEEEFQKVARQSIEISKEDRAVLEKLNEAGYNYVGWINALDRVSGGFTKAFDIPDFASAQPQLDEYNRMLTEMGSILTEDERKNSKMYQSVLAARDALKKYIDEVNLLKERYEQYGGSREEYDRNMAAAEEEFKNAMADAKAIADEIPQSIKDISNAIDGLNKKMDDFQSSVKSVESIIAQYNQTGVMTADMLQTLIGLAPEYIDLIDINSGSLSLNQEKLENLMKVNDNYMVQMAAMQIAKQYEALYTDLQSEKYDGLTEAEIRNMITTHALGGEIYNLAMQLFSGEINAKQFETAIQNAGKKGGLAAEKFRVLAEEISGSAVAMNNFITMANMLPNASNLINGKTLSEWGDMYGAGDITYAEFQKYYQKAKRGQYDKVETTSSGTNVWFPPTTIKSGGAGGNADKFKAEKDALSDLLEVYEHSILLIEHNEKDSAKAGKEIAAIYRKMQDEVHAQAERYRAAGVSENDELIRNLQKSWLSYQDKIEEVLHGIYEETVAAHERAINYLEHQYDSAEQRLDYSFMGENLKKQLDYQVKIQREAERELERLAKLGMDANSEAAQDVIDKWYDAEKAIRDISQKIQESILQPYEDFIDLADKFDIWEYMDFTKVDYLRMELQEVNNMLANGTMSLKEYNAQLKQLSYAIYDAQKELFEKQKSDVEAAKDEVVKGYQSNINSLKDQKEQIEDYYKTVIDGYNAEIDAWENRKDKVNEYYDTLIDNLNDVQAANERINAQVDYYNNRQKIITNLEQAQARSGVEWREKEMEYQQSLIDLDEEWNRTQKEWDIQDQIDMLNELKERALADIDLSIQAIRATIEAAEQAKTAAIESIEAEIAGIEEAITATEQKAEEEIALIDEQFKMLSQTIAEAIKNGTADGVANTQAEIDKALVDGTNAMLSFIDSTSQTFTQTSQQTANTVYGIYDTSFITPMYGEINDIASYMQTAMTDGASGAAQSALTQFRNSFITPLKNEMASILSQSEKAKQTIATATPQVMTTITGTSGKLLKPNSDLLKSYQQVDWARTSPTVYITNNNLNRESGANRTQNQIVQSILNSR